MNVRDLAPCHFRPVRGGAGKGAVANAVKSVLRSLQLVTAGGSAEDAQVAIDLRAVGVDDDAPNLLSKRKRQRRLAASGWPGNDDKRRKRLGHGNRDADSIGPPR